MLVIAKIIMISPVHSSFLARLWIVSHLPNFPSLLNLIWTDTTLAFSLSRVNLSLIRTDVTWLYASRWCCSEAPLWDLMLQMLHFSWSYDDLVLALLGYLRTSPPKSYLGVFYCLFFWIYVVVFFIWMMMFLFFFCDLWQWQCHEHWSCVLCIYEHCNFSAHYAGWWWIACIMYMSIVISVIIMPDVDG